MVVSKRMKDIQTDSLVQVRVAGRPWGEDQAYDLIALLSLTFGSFMARATYNDYIREAREGPASVGKEIDSGFRKEMLVCSVPIIWGLFHLIPNEVNLR